MKRAVILLAAAGLAFASACASAAKLSADEIVAKSLTARGGIEAWRRIDTMVWTGHIESAHAPAPSMPFRLEQKRPNRTRLRIEAMGETSVRVFDGVHGWKLRAARGQPQVQPYTLQELRSAQAGHGIDGPLIAWKTKGTAVTVAGVDEVGGRTAYRLSVTLANGGEEDVWVDTKTWLELRYDRPADGPAGPRRVSITYADYRNVDGVQVPFVIATGGGPGIAPDRMRLEKVVLNLPLPDSTFENPGAPRSLHHAWPAFAHEGAAPARP